MKKGFNILICAFALLAIFSCNNNMKSYADMLKDERKAIDRLRDKEGLDFIKEYPANGVFKENEFVRLANGVYMHVIDSGTGNRAVQEDEILCRYEVYVFKSDSARYNFFQTPINAVSFSYLSNYPSPGSNEYSWTNPYFYLSSSVGLPLMYVGDSAEVKLIVPFAAGNTAIQQTALGGEPFYFTRIKYIMPKYMQ